MRKLAFGKMAGIAAVLCVASVVASHAQTFTTLVDFNGTNGSFPVSSLIQGTDGNLFGTDSDGSNELFEITPKGNFVGVHYFCSQPHCADGTSPTDGILLGADGSFYGTTYGGGTGCVSLSTSGCGVVFKVTTGGASSVLYNFCTQPNCTDGALPSTWGGLVQGRTGNFYGTTWYGGTSTSSLCPFYQGPNGCGTIFEITPQGKLTTLYSFCTASPNCPDGYSPAGLTLGSNGNLYGATLYGGKLGYGTIFVITPAGKFTTLHSFNGATEGQNPVYPPIQGSDGNLYGTLPSGNSTNEGAIFKLTPPGQFTVLYNFCSEGGACTDGGSPYGLVQANDGNFYGTTLAGGEYGGGSVYKITPAGQLTTLYSFCQQTNCSDGEWPDAPVLQATDGIFYGTTLDGGTFKCFGISCGTLFSLSTGLPPFVESNPTFGKVGYKINILGNNLSDTTSVTFNGTPATFTVVSGTLIKATVPTGATTGTIQVTTPSGTLLSNVAFHVIP